MVIQQPSFTFNSSPMATSQLTSSDPGQVFTFKGNDFLSPANIQGNVDSFSKWDVAGTDMFGKNPNSKAILNITKKTANQIFTNPFGVANPANPVAANGFTSTATVPAGTIAGNGNGGAVLPGVVIQTPSPALLSDLANYNPVMWVNPSASNVTLGTMDAFSKVMGGNGIFTPPVFNNGPLYPYIAPLQPPFRDVNVSTLGGQVHSLPQSLIFPNTAQSGSNLWNTITPANAAVPVNTTSNGIGGTAQTGNMTTMLSIFAQLWATVIQSSQTPSTGSRPA